jgi:hypothetical protein
LPPDDRERSTGIASPRNVHGNIIHDLSSIKWRQAAAGL